MLLVTHDRHLMNSLACPILYLEDGRACCTPVMMHLWGRRSLRLHLLMSSKEPAKTGYGKEQRRRRAEYALRSKPVRMRMESAAHEEVELDS